MQDCGRADAVEDEELQATYSAPYGRGDGGPGGRLRVPAPARLRPLGGRPAAPLFGSRRPQSSSTGESSTSSSIPDRRTSVLPSVATLNLPTGVALEPALLTAAEISDSAPLSTARRSAPEPIKRRGSMRSAEQISAVVSATGTSSSRSSNPSFEACDIS